ENNQYAMGTSAQRHSASPDLYERGSAYGIPGEQVDGMDVLAVKDAGERAVAHCREGKGPYILELKTYRYRGHSMSDPAKYRTKDELDKMRKEHDPIDMVKKLLIDGNIIDEAGLKDIDKDVKAEVAKAAEFAQNSPEPDVSELFTDILIDA
ncbi:MAG TPA: pyruvate dehydrogenase (acetyl-transferring) E1 component subunit alpha, partial [Thalassospira sp.]|nr:pyruvate dehydrogenase (acetyl-transferring) E1 component subunit alpha [Thalassospira sp.]